MAVLNGCVGSTNSSLRSQDHVMQPDLSGALMTGHRRGSWVTSDCPHMLNQITGIDANVCSHAPRTLGTAASPACLSHAIRRRGIAPGSLADQTLPGGGS